MNMSDQQIRSLAIAVTAISDATVGIAVDEVLDALINALIIDDDDAEDVWEYIDKVEPV